MALENYFPHLTSAAYSLTSPATRDYNCSAWAAGVNSTWWWPDPMGVSFWPATVRRTETVEAFLEAFESIGYIRGADESLEAGIEKVALYASGAVPKHAARQVENGRWTSKLGELEDIEHTLESLTGVWYGTVVAILKRARRRDESAPDTQ